MASEITINSRDDFDRFRRKLGNLQPILNQIGALITSQAQGAFQQQRLGDIAWLGRYPGMADPFVNIAGLVSDLNAGGQPKARRFQRRPAGIDTGRMMNSITWETTRDSVSIGSNVEYATFHQEGGISFMPVTAAAKAGLAEFLRSEQAQQTAELLRVNAPQAAGSATLHTRLGFLFQLGVLETDHVARPFLGVTDQAERDIVELIEEMIAA